MADGRAAVVQCPRCGTKHQAFEYEGAVCQSCRDEFYEGWTSEDFALAEADRKNDEEREERL